MAKFEHLAIYKAAYDLLVQLHKLHPTFPKAYKYTVGQSLLETFEQVMTRLDKIIQMEKLQK